MQLAAAVGISMVDLEKSVVGWPEQGKVGTSDYSLCNYLPTTSVWPAGGPIC